MRKTTFIVGGKEITDPLTIKFNVPFGEEENVDTVEIKVYNLKDSTINGIATKTRAILSAGYVDDNGVIFNGTLKKKETKWEGLDKITYFYCSDATDDYITATFKKTYARNTQASVILRELAQAAGLTIADLDLPIDFTYRSGKVLNGKIKTLASEIAKDCKAKLFINKGQMFVRVKSKGDNLGLDISKETGLINQPEEIVEQKEDKTIKKGYKLKLLLNPRITTDALIRLTSKKVSGTFRVTKGEHKSDGDTYFTECEVVPA